MPAETHSHGPARSSENVRETLQAILERLPAFETASAGKELEEIKLADLGLDDLDVIDLVETLAEEVGERGLMAVDEVSLMECDTVGELLGLLGTALGGSAGPRSSPDAGAVASSANPSTGGEISPGASGDNGREGTEKTTAAVPSDESIEAIERAVGYHFSDRTLLREALSHRSWASEARNSQNAAYPSNERLEFLGDAVLQMIATDYIYRQYRHLKEGEMAKARAAVVSSASLAEVAEELGIGEHLLLGKGEDASGGREKPSILADAVEAVIGAVYLDGGWEAASSVVMSVFKKRLDDAAAGPGSGDFKTRLQELTLKLGKGLPSYSVIASGPDHAKRFFAEVRVDGELVGAGEGRSKKQAEQGAARRAFERIARRIEGEQSA